MIPAVTDLAAAGFFSPLASHFARIMEELAGGPDPLTALAAAAVSRWTQAGHTCLRLDTLAGQALAGREGNLPAGWRWPESQAWLAALHNSPLVSDGSEPRPLVLEPPDRLYLYRYWEHERQLAGLFRERARRPHREPDLPLLRQLLGQLMPAAGNAGTSTDRYWQQRAAVTGLLKDLTLITGGPGTGKTYTIVRLVALALEYAVRRGMHPPRILVLAPTGKAAARLQEAFQLFLESPAATALHPASLVAFPRNPSTIHRALRPLPSPEQPFRHHAANPLATGLVIVDEASMVDLALMHRLTSALPARAGLVLAGDSHQLPPVETGGVFGDLCQTSLCCPPSRPFRQILEQLLPAGTDGGATRPGTSGPAPEAPGIWDSLSGLANSFRFATDQGIGQLARAIRSGEPDRVLAVLAGDSSLQTGFHPYGQAAGLPEILNPLLGRHWPAFRQDPSPSSRLNGLPRFRILCAHRHGPDGMDGVNRLVELWLIRQGLIPADTGWYDGRVVLITANDSETGLFNGDLGILCRTEGGAGPLAACFPGPAGQERLIAPARLPAHETSFAVTVHRSQGSEFDHVLLILPERPSPVVTQELLYTAVTRARQRVEIISPPGVLAAAVRQHEERYSNLGELLWRQDGGSAGGGPVPAGG